LFDFGTGEDECFYLAIKEFQRRLKYHTTADWEDRTPEEVAGKAPPKMKQWLRRVRGY
jgi:hypothetical protein